MPLVSLGGRVIAQDGRLELTGTHTHTKYCNPYCGCAPRVHNDDGHSDINSLIPAFPDCQIHVLQLYPHIQEALSLLMSFDVTSCPSLLSVTQDRVGVACNDHAHSSYTIDMFCLQDKGCGTL